MTKYIHIGYPKCFSTTLQRSFFDVHPDLYHLGIGCGSNTGYRSSEIAACMENYLVYARQFAWKEKRDRFVAHFEEHFSKADTEDYAGAGISLEHLAFSFTTDNIDTVEKARRMKALFGENTRIIMMVRNQLDLIASLYRESVRMGYAGSYNDFLHFVVLLKDRNFLYDFRYDLVYACYAELFGAENIIVLPVEEMRDAAGNMLEDDTGSCVLFNRLCDFLGISRLDKSPGHFNAALRASEIATKAQLNKQLTHDLGNPMYGRGVSFHRLNEYIELEFPDRFSEAFIYLDVVTKRKSIEMARKTEGRISGDVPEPWLLDYLGEFYAAGNQIFNKQIGNVLPDTYAFETDVVSSEALCTH